MKEVVEAMGKGRRVRPIDRDKEGREAAVERDRGRDAEAVRLSLEDPKEAGEVAEGKEAR